MKISKAKLKIMVECKTMMDFVRNNKYQFIFLCARYRFNKNIADIICEYYTNSTFTCKYMFLYYERDLRKYKDNKYRDDNHLWARIIKKYKNQNINKLSKLNILMCDYYISEIFKKERKLKEKIK